MNRNRSFALALLGLICLLGTACGNKADLTRPEPAPASTASR
ncbi:MAG: hypothetical protein ACT4NL_06270 [Pseudomarimonas sp.]